MAIERQLLYTLGSNESDSILDMRYALTDEGKRWTLDAIQRSGYVGPAPVTLSKSLSTGEPAEADQRAHHSGTRAQSQSAS